jgi:competence protein ComEA
MFPNFSTTQKRAIYVVLAAALSLTAIFFSLSQSRSAAQDNSSFSNTTGVPQLSAPPIPMPTIASTIVIDVAGKVLHPGVYKLPQGSRAIDAIKRAGNALKGVSLMDINLAEILMDGQQIVVGAPIAVSAKKSGTSKSSSGAGSKITKGTININTASASQLEQLPGIGAVMATRILAYRVAHGAFGTTADLAKVSGMGKSKFANLKSFIRV